MTNVTQRLRGLCFGKEELPQEVLDWIVKNNLWNLWVPKIYGGLELSLSKGLEKLRFLAQIDGSLGWTVTLCSGANFFIGNLKTEVTDEIFPTKEGSVCFGGSGGIFGTAEKLGEGFIISGTWKYATGAPYLTHFTLNAKIQENGKDVLLEDGSPLVRSFLLESKDVDVMRDWNTMGLKATATHSFKVNSKWIHGRYSFYYDELYLSHPIFKVPFTVFADLTLWVNYIGIAAHILEEARNVSIPNGNLLKLLAIITKADYQVVEYATRIETLIENDRRVPKPLMEEIHSMASEAIRSLSEGIIGLHPYLGIRAASETHPLNQCFRDYFTATQHHIFCGTGVEINRKKPR